MSNDPVAKIDNAEAWNDFCDLLKKGGDVILRDDLELSTFDRAEGMRYLGRLLRAGLFSFSERTGPEYPKFRPMPEARQLAPHGWRHQTDFVATDLPAQRS
ncbi:MAG: hypothetical protein ACKVK6_03565 [bacterium]